MKTIFYLNRKVELYIEVPEELVEIQCFLFSVNETGYNLVPVPDNYGEELQTLTKEEFETELSVIRDRTLARLSPEYNINLRDNSKEYPYRLNIPYKETDLAHLKSSSIQSLLDSCREVREVLASTSDTIKLAGYNAKVVIANAVLSDSANPYQIYALQQEVYIRGKGESLKDLAQKNYQE